MEEEKKTREGRRERKRRLIKAREEWMQPGYHLVRAYDFR